MDIDLKYLIDSGIIDVPNIQSILEMKKRQELLDNHPYKIWMGSNGKWYTYLPDEEKGRVLKRKVREKILKTLLSNIKIVLCQTRLLTICLLNGMTIAVTSAESLSRRTRGCAKSTTGTLRNLVKDGLEV